MGEPSLEYWLLVPNLNAWLANNNGGDRQSVKRSEHRGLWINALRALSIQQEYRFR